MSDNASYGNNNGAGDGMANADLDSTAKFSRDELVRGWREYETRTPRILPLVKYAAKTDMGQVRENNEDKFDYYEPEIPAILAARGSLYAVADGVGGALAGQIASEMMLKNLITGYYDHAAPDMETALREAISDANSRVYGLAQMIPERSGMGTTLTTLVFIENQVIVAQLGDSRAYLIRDGAIRQVTQDHSWVEEQVRAGLMSRADAENSPFRNVITRSIGAGPVVQPDFFVEQAVINDVWVLCSDGLTTYVEDAEIERIAGKHAPSEATRQLIELANARGGRDNITVFALSVRDLIPYDLGVSEETEAVTIPRTSSGTGQLDMAAVSAAMTATLPPQATNHAYLAESRQRTGWRKLFGR